MPYIQPMLGDIELQLVQKLDVGGTLATADQAVPALEGDLVQGLGRMASRISLSGILTGSEAGRDLEGLREKFHSAQPVDFVADLATATRVVQVLIEEMEVRELAGKPERFEYAFILREHIAPTPPATEEPQKPTVSQPAIIESELPESVPSEQTDVRIDEGLGTLIVEVIVDGQPDYDYSGVTVTVEGRRDDSSPLSRSINNRSENIWTEEDFPAGEYSITASAKSQSMSGSRETAVRPAETASETITLHPAPSNIAKTFVVHFSMDNSFIEPGLCQVLQRAAEYAQSHPRDKLIILGHTDLVGSAEYNQKLSERRARSVYAFLTFGRDDDARLQAVDEWDNLRRKASQWQRDIQDNWSTREYQFMLQDLDYYIGNIDGNHGPKTRDAVSDFQDYHGLLPTGAMDDLTWRLLIEDYMFLYSLSVPDDRFFRNAGNGCDNGPLKWLGAGEQDPVKKTQNAWRPNRRTELLFVQGEKMPCEVPKPRTFDKPSPGGSWCLGRTYDDNTPEAKIKRQDFLSRDGEEQNKWLVEPAEPGRTIIRGTIIKDTNDGPPFAHAKYVLIAPDGEYLHTDSRGRPDLGERPQGERQGEGIANQADENGNYGYPEETPVGTYILEIQDIDDPRLARWMDDKNYEARGSVIFQPMNLSTEIVELATQMNQMSPKPSKSTNVVVQTGYMASPPREPIISISGSPIVVVKKSYTNPVRKEITLKVEPPFRGKGIFSCYSASDAVVFFDRKENGHQVVIPVSGKEYSGKLLTGNGVKLYVEGIKPSNSSPDIMLKLALDKGRPQDKPPAYERLTAILLNLNLCQATEDLSNVHDCLPEPTSSDDKWQKGGVVCLNPDLSRDNAVLKAEVVPHMACILVLRNVIIRGNTVGSLDDKAEFLNGDRTAMNGNPITFSTFNPYNVFRTRGKNPSKASRDTGFQLGFQSLATGPADPNYDGDRVSATVIPIPIIELESSIVIVNKPHTMPGRRKVTLKTSGKSPRSGTFNVSENPDRIQIFEDRNSDKRINIPTTLTKEQLTAGVDWFIAGIQPSSAEDDIELTLSIDADPAKSMPDAPQATARMTAVELTLDICASRRDASTPPEALPSPTVSSSPGATATDKWFCGRYVHLQDDIIKHHGRALLRVHEPKPSDLKGNWVLSLRRVILQSVADTMEIGPSDNFKRLRLFDNEIPFNGEVEIPDGSNNDQNIMPEDFGPEPDSVKEFWVEGAIVSNDLRDIGFQLGFWGKDKDGKETIDDDGDRISMTVVRFSNLKATVPSTQPLGVAAHPPQIPSSKYLVGYGSSIDGKNFDEDFQTNIPLVLVFDSLPKTMPVKLEVMVTPSGVPVIWSIQRDTRLAPHGDHPDIIGLSANYLPTLALDKTKPLEAALATDAIGSFHIRPFVDCNGNGQFEHNDQKGNRIDREPFIIMNLVLIRVGGAIGSGSAAIVSSNSSVSNSENAYTNPPNATRKINNYRPTNRQDFKFYSGENLPERAAVHNVATIVVVGGGWNGRKGLDRLFAGWINNLVFNDTYARYFNTKNGRYHYHKSIVASNRPSTFEQDPVAFFVKQIPPNPPPGYAFVDADPNIISNTILDTSIFVSNDEGMGGNTAVGTEGEKGPPGSPPAGPHRGIRTTDLAIGQTWEVHMWDSPGCTCYSKHIECPDCLLEWFNFNMKFRCDLCFWTNVKGLPDPTPVPISIGSTPVPDAACCLYSTVQSNNWDIQYRILFNINTGDIIDEKKATVSLQRDPSPARLAKPVNGEQLEVYRPIAARLASLNARE